MCSQHSWKSQHLLSFLGWDLGDIPIAPAKGLLLVQVLITWGLSMPIKLENSKSCSATCLCYSGKQVQCSYIQPSKHSGTTWWFPEQCNFIFKNNQKDGIILQYNAFSFVLFPFWFDDYFDVLWNSTQRSWLISFGRNADECPIPCYREQLTSD